MKAAPSLIRALLLPVALGVSLLVNVGLVWRVSRSTAPARPPLAETGTKPNATPLKTTAPQAEPKPFEWSQIESEDFVTYIANLRRIGCPEITIQRLVSVELDSLYPNAEESRITTNHQRSSHPASGAVVVKLQDKQRIMEQLFAPKTPAGATTASPSVSNIAATGARSDVPTQQQQPPSTVASARPANLPMVLQETTGKAAALSPSELQQVAAIREEFVANIGGPNQNPNDPEYLSRWRSAQSIADDQLKAQIGWTAYNQLGVIAAQEAYAKAYPELAQ